MAHFKKSVPRDYIFRGLSKASKGEVVRKPCDAGDVSQRSKRALNRPQMWSKNKLLVFVLIPF